MRDTVTVRVPATTANLGPGYDVLGMALSIWMEVTVTRSDKFEMEISGEGSGEVSADSDNIIVESCKIAFNLAKVEFPPLKFTINSNIPFGCGCGSSSAAAVAGFLAGLAINGHTLATRDEGMLQIISDLEGHPDNAAPAIYGGLQLGMKGTRFATHRIPTPPGLICVLFCPKKKMKQNTHATRKLIPTEISMQDAIHNMSRTALLTLALTTNQLGKLQECLGDKMHQEQRGAALFPHMSPAIEAAMAAGAEYCFLSGAGPTICAFVSGRYGDLLAQPQEERVCDNVAAAMVKAAADAGVEGTAIVTHPSEIGAHIVGETTVKENIKYSTF